MLVFPDVRGLHDFYRELALRFAEQGHAALVVDYYGRSAGPESRASGIGFADAGFDFMAHASKLSSTELEADFGTALNFLREQAAPTSTFTIGFCMGGRQSYLSSARGENLNGCMGFYGSLGLRNGVNVLETVPLMRSPILAMQAGSDTDPDNFPNAAFDAALTDAGIAHEVIVYDAPHSFFDVNFAEYAEVCADAWAKIKAFIATYS